MNMKRVLFENLSKSDLTEYSSLLANNTKKEKWKILRSSILQKTAFPDLYPEDLETFLISDFSVLNQIYNDKNILSSDDIKLAKSIFNYSKYWASKIGNYFISKYDKLGISTCFYCDMNYVFPYQTGKSKKRMFDLDHFFENADSPLTAISLYNFVPSCQVCNSRIKHDKPFNVLYHLENEPDINDFNCISPSSINYKFDENVKIMVTENSSGVGFFGDSNKFNITFDTDETNYKRIIKGFNLEERYNFPMIKKQALDLLNCKRKFPDTRIQKIANFFNNNYCDVYSAIFRLDKDSEENAVFGKLYKDILKYND